MTTGEDPLGFCSEELQALRDAGLHRELRTVQSAQQVTMKVDGKELLTFSSNNYLGLANHPKVCKAAADAIEQFGTSAGSARLVTGNHSIHNELERSLADFKGTPDAVVFSSGYMASLALATLLREGDAVFSDRLNHASIVDGCRLAKARTEVYHHGDANHLESLLQLWRRDNPGSRALVVTDSVFSMDGDLAPLPDIVESCERHGAMLMVDEAHATGVLGPGGRGSLAHFDLAGRVHICMGTLSKSLASAGGFLAGSRSLCELLRNRARTFMFDTGLPPASAAAALAALNVLRQEPDRPERVRHLASRLAEGLSEIGVETARPVAAIVPIPAGEPAAAVELSRKLLALGILVPAIRPPAVPRGTARLRATVCATHVEEELDRLVHALETIRE